MGDKFSSHLNLPILGDFENCYFLVSPELGARGQIINDISCILALIIIGKGLAIN